MVGRCLRFWKLSSTCVCVRYACPSSIPDVLVRCCGRIHVRSRVCAHTTRRATWPFHHSSSCLGHYPKPGAGQRKQSSRVRFGCFRCNCCEHTPYGGYRHRVYITAAVTTLCQAKPGQQSSPKGQSFSCLSKQQRPCI